MELDMCGSSCIWAGPRATVLRGLQQEPPTPTGRWAAPPWLFTKCGLEKHREQEACPAGHLPGRGPDLHLNRGFPPSGCMEALPLGPAVCVDLISITGCHTEPPAECRVDQNPRPRLRVHPPGPGSQPCRPQEKPAPSPDATWTPRSPHREPTKDQTAFSRKGVRAKGHIWKREGCPIPKVHNPTVGFPGHRLKQNTPETWNWECTHLPKPHQQIKPPLPALVSDTCHPSVPSYKVSCKRL